MKKIKEEQRKGKRERGGKNEWELNHKMII